MNCDIRGPKKAFILTAHNAEFTDVRIFQKFLSSAHPLPGVDLLSRRNRAQWSGDALDIAWNEFAETAKAFNLRRFSVKRLCWKFDRQYLYYLLRPDGIGLGLIMDPESQPRVLEIEAAFQGLDISSAILGA